MRVMTAQGICAMDDRLRFLAAEDSSCTGDKSRQKQGYGVDKSRQKQGYGVDKSRQKQGYGVDKSRQKQGYGVVSRWAWGLSQLHGL